MRPLTELVNTVEPAMPLVRQWIAASNKPVEVLECERAAGERALLAVQVTTRSPMGAIAFETGGLLIDGGWLRVLGAGSARLPRSIDEWNGLPAGPHRFPGACLVADDVVGGFFAINGGAFEGTNGNVFYLAPDTLRWEDTDRSFSLWLQWALAADLDEYYENARWPGWEADVRSLAGEMAFSIFPFLFSKGPVRDRSRRAVALEELWRLHAIHLPQQLD